MDFEFYEIIMTWYSVDSNNPKFFRTSITDWFPYYNFYIKYKIMCINLTFDCETYQNRDSSLCWNLQKEIFIIRIFLTAVRLVNTAFISFQYWYNYIYKFSDSWHFLRHSVSFQSLTYMHLTICYNIYVVTFAPSALAEFIWLI